MADGDMDGHPLAHDLLPLPSVELEAGEVGNPADEGEERVDPRRVLGADVEGDPVDPEIAAPPAHLGDLPGCLHHVLLRDHETEVLGEKGEPAEEQPLVDPVDHEAHPSSASRPRVFRISPGAHQPRRARVTPCRICPSSGREWASVPMESFTPRSRTSRIWGSSRSIRKGEALISRAVPAAFAASMTRSISTWEAGREGKSRPVGWPRMSTCSLETAVRIRRVMTSFSSLSAEWTEAMTRSRSARTRSGSPRVPSARMSTSIPARSWQPDPRFTRSISFPWAFTPSASRPWVIPRVEEWSDTRRYSYPSSVPAAANSPRVRCPSVAVVWMWRSPRMAFSSTRTGRSPASARSISPRSSRISGGK